MSDERTIFYGTGQVNGQDVTNDGYDGVAGKIKAMPHETHLLVADAETYEHFKRSEQHPASAETTAQIFIEVIACPDEPIGATTGELSRRHRIYHLYLTQRDPRNAPHHVRRVGNTWRRWTSCSCFTPIAPHTRVDGQCRPSSIDDC